ncbi:MAG: phosphoribosylanthranilate isomerase [gamma proteobacterium symbiont of Bathyaustriella thionipta]|nr:phosphoribosylanthranilate isomerase [gamma proteobacterium symbiont of Bathyaustriella thionipta]
MSRTRVKICGLTRVDNVLDAVHCGVDAIGLVFFSKSSRCVEIQQAGEIVRNMPPFVTTVGLFVDADADFMRSVLSQVPLDCLQFHGAESEAFCKSWFRPYIKAIRMSDKVNLKAEEKAFASASALLLDTWVAGQAGGTGQAFNWDLIPQDLQKPLILAGGLQAENITEAIRKVQPYAVDVSGGVESAKGIKDKVKMQQFMQGVARA